MILLRLRLRRSDRGCLKPHSLPLRPQAPTQIDVESSRRQQGTAKGSPEGNFFLGISVPVSEMELANLQKKFVYYSPRTEYTTRAGYRQPRQSQAMHHRTRAGRRRPLALRAARGARMCGSIPGSVGPRIQPHTARSTTAPKRCPTTAFRQRFTCQSVTVTAGSQKYASTRPNRRPRHHLIFYSTYLVRCPRAIAIHEKVREHAPSDGRASCM